MIHSAYPGHSLSLPQGQNPAQVADTSNRGLRPRSLTPTCCVASGRQTSEVQPSALFASLSFSLSDSLKSPIGAADDTLSPTFLT